MRWVASMAADVFHILARGGIFRYPRDAKDPSKPGRLHPRVPVILGSRNEVERVAGYHA